MMNNFFSQLASQKTFVIGIIYFIIIFIMACKNPDSSDGSQVKYMYGSDSRELIYQSTLLKLLSPIGAIEIDGKIKCSGVLVEQKVVLTAENCFHSINAKRDLNPNTYFVPYLEIQTVNNNIRSDGRKYKVIKAQFGGFTPKNKDTNKNWAVLGLEKHPTSTDGSPLVPFGIYDRKLKTGTNVDLATLRIHDGDPFLLRQSSCTIKHVYGSEWPNLLLHDCDEDNSVSAGGPLLVECPNSKNATNNSYCVAAILTGFLSTGQNTTNTRPLRYSHRAANLAISHQAWGRTIRNFTTD